MKNNRLKVLLERADTILYDEAKNSLGLLKAVPCNLKLYIIEFDDGRTNYPFTAMTDEQALDKFRAKLDLYGDELTAKKLHKKGCRGLFCGGGENERQVFPLPEKSKKKKK